MSVTFSAAQKVGSEVVWLTDDDTTLNVSNSNAFHLLTLLGVTPDYCGSFEGDELQSLKRSAEVAVRMLAINPNIDAGTETVVDDSGPGATMVHCGRREGYYAHRLEALLTIIDIALFNNGFVTFG